MRGIGEEISCRARAIACIGAIAARSGRSHGDRDDRTGIGAIARGSRRSHADRHDRARIATIARGSRRSRVDRAPIS
jgi:hypothetical protein